MPRRIIIIVSAILVIVVPAIVIVWLVSRNPKLQNVVLKVANVNAAGSTNTVKTNTNTTSTDPRAKDRAAITFSARNFTERYGSGSNQNNFANILDAKTFTTATYAGTLDVEIAHAKQTLNPTPFTSTITKAVSISITGLTTASANVTVGTQRQETIDRATRIYYQDLIVQVVKDGQNWRVSGATWKS